MRNRPKLFGRFYPTNRGLRQKYFNSNKYLFEHFKVLDITFPIHNIFEYTQDISIPVEKVPPSTLTIYHQNETLSALEFYIRQGIRSSSNIGKKNIHSLETKLIEGGRIQIGEIININGTPFGKFTFFQTQDSLCLTLTMKSEIVESGLLERNYPSDLADFKYEMQKKYNPKKLAEYSALYIFKLSGAVYKIQRSQSKIQMVGKSTELLKSSYFVSNRGYSKTSDSIYNFESVDSSYKKTWKYGRFNNEEVEVRRHNYQFHYFYDSLHLKKSFIDNNTHQMYFLDSTVNRTSQFTQYNNNQIVKRAITFGSHIPDYHKVSISNYAFWHTVVEDFGEKIYELKPDYNEKGLVQKLRETFYDHKGNINFVKVYTLYYQ